MDVAYSNLEMESLPEVGKDKPKWASFLVIASGFFIMTLLVITIGAIFGYTYCYIEHRCIKPEVMFKRITHGGHCGSVVMRKIEARQLGSNDTTVGVNGTTVGVNGTAVGVNGTAVGVNGTAVGVNSTAVGVIGTAVGINGTAVGVTGTAVSINGTALSI